MDMSHEVAGATLFVVMIRKRKLSPTLDSLSTISVHTLLIFKQAKKSPGSVIPTAAGVKKSSRIVRRIFPLSPSRSLP